MEQQGHGHSPFLRQVAADIVRRYGADLREIAIVFNNQRPVHYMRQYLAEFQKQVCWSPQFFTIQDFVRQSSPRQEINRTAQVFLLNQLHTALQRERNPGYEESLDHFFPVAEMILDDFAQMDYELARVELVFRELAGMAELDRQFDFLSDEQKDFLMRFWSAFSPDQHTGMQARFLYLWKLLPVLYQRFKAALEADGTHTIAGIYRDLAEAKLGTRDIAGDYKQVLFVGFNALNACEAHLFRKWQDEGKALFYFDADRYYFEDPMMEAGHFIRQNTGSYGLRNVLGDFSSAITGQRPPGQEIRIAGAPGKIAQAKVLAQLLRDMPPDGTAAVILADESLLVPVLQSIPENIDPKKVNITMGYPMSESLTHGMLEIFMECQLRYAAAGSGVGRLDPAGEMDRTLLVDLIGHPFMGSSVRDRFALLEALALYKEPVLPLSWVQDQLPAPALKYPGFFTRMEDVSGLMAGLHELLEILILDPALEEVRGHIELALIEKAMQVLRQLQQGFEAYPGLSIPLAVKLIRRLLGKLTATLPGDPLSGLQIMGLLESRNLNFDVIYLLGAGEGNLPVLKAAPSFIPYNLRRAYRLPVIENQQALSAYLFYRLLSGFNNFTIVYNAVVDYQNSGEITRFARQIQYESDLSVVELPVMVAEADRDDVSMVAKTPRIAAEKLSISKTGEVWERLQSFLAGTPKEERRYLSASAFTLYLNSPLEFFFRYIAGIKEPPEVKTEIQSNRLGTVIHRTMELAYRPSMERQEPISPETIDRLLSNLHVLCERAVLEEFYGLSPSGSHFSESSTKPRFSSQERIVLRLCEEYCRMFLEHDRKAEAGLIILELENARDYLLEFPIQVGGQENSVLLKGIIDRVDIKDGQQRIVDYKTGGDELEIKASNKEDGGAYACDSLYYDFFRDNWDNSNKAFIQTLFYTYIYEQLTGSKDIQPHLYSIRRIRSEGSEFKFKMPYKGTYPVNGAVLEQVKTDFLVFLRQKLEELFNPEIPFVHPPDATVYPNSPYVDFLNT